MRIDVYAHDGQHLGAADSFGEAKRMHIGSLPEELIPAYGGVSPEGRPLLFSDELTPELCAKYNLTTP